MQCVFLCTVCCVSFSTIQAKINISMSYTPPEGAGGGSGGGGGNKQAADDEDEGDLGDEITEEPAAGETLTGEGGGKTSAATEEASVYLYLHYQLNYVII